MPLAESSLRLVTGASVSSTRTLKMLSYASVRLSAAHDSPVTQLAPRPSRPWRGVVPLHDCALPVARVTTRICDRYPVVTDIASFEPFGDTARPVRLAVGDGAATGNMLRFT